MLSIGMLKAGTDLGAYYAKDDYYGGDAASLSDDELSLDSDHGAGAGSGAEADYSGLESRILSRDATRGASGNDGSERPADTVTGGADATVEEPITGSTRGKGQWFGKGAEALGLSGSVDPVVLNRLIEGLLPNGVELGIRGGKTAEKEHVGGWDLTFSAPKSVSVLAELTGSSALFRAHHQAVKEAVNWLEEEAATIRRAGFLGKKTEQTGNLVVALFQHDTSREQDPQLHTHALVMNATEREDGKWRSVYSKPIFEHKMAAGNVYRAALAQRMQALGFDTERTHADGRFEITAVPESVVEVFSTRRKQIENKLEAWEGEGAATSARAALVTRSKKRNADLPALREDWNQAAAVLGFDAQATLIAGRQKGIERTPAASTREADELLRLAVERLSEREATFTNAELVGAALAEGMGRLDVASARAAIERSLGNTGRGLYEARIGERKAWTTPKSVEQERRYEVLVEQGRKAMQPAVPLKQARRLLETSSLNDGQREAVKLIVSSPDQFVAVVGRPGTGKTFMLPQVKALLESQGFTAVGMAPNGAAAKELEHVGGLRGARTVASQLARIGRTVGSLRGMDSIARANALQEFRQQVWVVDESSQIHNGDMRKLVTFASITGARVAFIGDPAQLGAINAGKPFERLLGKGIRQVELNKILRQKHESGRDLVRTAIDRDISGAMKMLDPHVQILASEDARHAEMVRQWSGSDARESTLMIALRNASKTRLNDLARDWLRSNGKLGEEVSATQLLPVFGSKADRTIAATYTVGDVIRFTKAYGRAGIDKDSYWTIRAVEGKDSVNRLTLSDGDRRLSFNARTVASAMRSTEHFRPRTTSLAVNDRIVWNRPDRDKGLVNGDVLTVERLVDGKVMARSGDGRSIAIDGDAGAKDRHWEHYYATSLYKSQGKTAAIVLVDAPVRDAHLMDHHAFLVGISRHKEQVRFFTDDREELERRVILNPGDKSSSQEGRQEHRLDGLRRQLAIVARVFGAPREPAREPERSSRADLGPVSLAKAPELNQNTEELAPPVSGALNRSSDKQPTRDRGLSF